MIDSSTARPHAEARLSGRLAAAFVVVVALAVGLAVVQLALVQHDYLTAWTFAKPVSLVRLADDAGRLDFGPFGAREPWIEETYEAHSQRWGTTLLFLSLGEVTGADARDLAWASPLGVVPFLIGLVFLFSRFAQTGAPLGLAFLVAALGFVLNYQMVIWFYHGGGWPGTTLALLMIGALFAFERVPSRRWLYAGAAIIFLLLQFPIYHSTAVISFMLLSVLAAYGLLLRLVSAVRWRGPASPAPQIKQRFAPTGGRLAEHYSNLAVIALAMVFIDPISVFMLDGLGPIVQSPGTTLSAFFVSYFEGDNFFNPNFTGFAFATRVALMAPLVYMMTVSTFLWLRELLQLWRSGASEGGQLVVHGLYLTAVLTLTSSLMFGGAPRATEPYFFILLAFPLLLFRPWRVARPAALSPFPVALAAGAVIVTVASLIVVLRDPYTEQAYATPAEEAAGFWAARHIDVGYFADAKLANLALVQTHDTPVVNPVVNGVTIRDLEPVFYAGRRAFAEGLRARGARLALLSDRNVEDSGYPKPALFMINEPIRALPDYDFDSAGFGRVYDNGSERVILLPEAQR
jgi:hypothetical protein